MLKRRVTARNGEQQCKTEYTALIFGGDLIVYVTSLEVFETLNFKKFLQWGIHLIHLLYVVIFETLSSNRVIIVIQ